MLKSLIKQFVDEIKDTGDIADEVLIDNFVRNLANMKNMLEKDNNKRISFQFGDEVEVYTEAKVIAIEILSVLSVLEYEKMRDKIVELNFFEIVTGHFKKYV